MDTDDKIQETPLPVVEKQPTEKYGSLLTKLIPGWWKLAAYVVVLAIIVGIAGRVGYDVRDYSAQKQIAAEQADKIKQQHDYEEKVAALIVLQHQISQSLQDTLAVNQILIDQTQGQTIIKEIHDHPVYLECTVPPSGVKLLNDQARKFNELRAHE